MIRQVVFTFVKRFRPQSSGLFFVEKFSKGNPLNISERRELSIIKGERLTKGYLLFNSDRGGSAKDGTAAGL